MISHNYDGDMLSDEISQIHFSPGFITSNFTGINSNNEIIKQFEASHGTVSDMWKDHLNNKEKHYSYLYNILIYHLGVLYS